MVKTLRKFKEAILILVPLFCFYLFFQTRGIFGGDSGDLVAAAAVWGIPHPPGYPLYTFISALLIRLPFFTPAWRVALLSSLPSALAVVFLYLTLRQLVKSRLISLTASLTLAFAYIFWLNAEVAEVFGLNSFFICLLIFLILSWHQKPTARRFYLFSFFLGLSLTHHQTILFLLPAFLYLVIKRLPLKNLKRILLKSFLLFATPNIPARFPLR